MYDGLTRRGIQVFKSHDDFKKWCKEWNEMRRLFYNIEWVKKYEPGVKVVNS